MWGGCRGGKVEEIIHFGTLGIEKPFKFEIKFVRNIWNGDLLDSPASCSEGSSCLSFVVSLLMHKTSSRHQAGYENEEHLRTTGTNGHGLIGTLSCQYDSDLVKISQNVNITSTPLCSKHVKKKFFWLLLNGLFSSENVVRIELIFIFFFFLIKSDFIN